MTDSAILSVSLMCLRRVNPQSSRDASHKTGLDISALDVNEDKTHAILAGREILKSIRVTGSRCSEETNLRSAIINYNYHSSTASAAFARNRETLDIHDVKWSNGSYNTIIATAPASGKIVLYDLNRPGYELARLHEHHRQVHKLAFNPFQGALLLSASQDASVKLWDLRDLRKEAMTVASKLKYSGMSEGIRDIKWSPEDVLEFAFGTDNGVIQKWDFKHSKAPKLKINAHDRMCSSIDWHPDGKHLISASADRTVKVWDFKTEARRQRPAWILRTPYPISNVRWRPPCWSAESREQGTWQCTQIATSYGREHPAVHIWDFRRPYLPFRELIRYNTAPTDMLWASQSLLWTVGREGVFAQTDCHFAPKVVNRRNMQALAVSSLGEISAFTQRRMSSRSPGLGYTSPSIPVDGSREKRISPDKIGFERTSVDDSVDDSFLISSFKRHHGRTASNRSTRSYGSTPSSSDDTKKPKVRSLDTILFKNKDSYKPNQAALRGTLPGTVDVPHFTYLAYKYKAAALSEPMAHDSVNHISRNFEQNAEYAQKASYYKVAQSFRVAGMLASLVVQRTADGTRKRPLGLVHALPSATAARPLNESSQREQNQNQGPHPNPAKRAVYGNHGPQQQSVFESSSNVATPLARPLGNSSFQSTASSSLPDVEPEEDIVLPPSIVQPTRVLSAKSVGLATDKDVTVGGPGPSEPLWYGSTDELENRRAMMNSWRAHPRTPLNLERSTGQGIDIRGQPPVGRRQSDESFAMFFSSTDSPRGLSVVGSSASTQPQTQRTRHIPEEWEEGKSLYDSSTNSDTQSFSGPLSQRAGSDVGNADQSLETSGRRISDIGQDGSPESNPSVKVRQDLGALSMNNRFLRNSSSESDAFLSSERSLASASRDSIENMETSATVIADERSGNLVSPRSSTQKAEPRTATTDGQAVPRRLTDPDPAKEPLGTANFLSTDVADAEATEPFTLIDMLRNLLRYHTDILSDAQAISHLLLLLIPLIPPTHPLQNSETTPTLTTYSDHFTTLGMSPAQIETILSTSLTHLTRIGISPLQAESILSTYHAQLHSLSLFNAAAYLRRLAYPTYPAVYEQGLKETQLGLLCQQCKSPINNARDKMRCESCHERQAECPICWSRTSPYEGPWKRKKAKVKRKGRSWDDSNGKVEAYSAVPVDALPSPNYADTISAKPATPPTHAVLWSWCPICGHGGHFACLSAWFNDLAASEGACPTAGCLCDCIAGPRRDERVRALENKMAERELGRINRDEWRVGESRAVSKVRGALGAKEEGKGRRVRVVEPGDD